MTNPPNNQPWNAPEPHPAESTAPFPGQTGPTGGQPPPMPDFNAPPPMQQPFHPPPKKKKSGVLIALAIVLVLALVGGGGFAAFKFLTKDDSSSSDSEKSDGKKKDDEPEGKKLESASKIFSVTVPKTLKEAPLGPEEKAEFLLVPRKLAGKENAEDNRIRIGEVGPEYAGKSPEEILQIFETKFEDAASEGVTYDSELNKKDGRTVLEMTATQKPQSESDTEWFAHYYIVEVPGGNSIGITCEWDKPNDAVMSKACTQVGKSITFPESASSSKGPDASTEPTDAPDSSPKPTKNSNGATTKPSD